MVAAFTLMDWSRAGLLQVKPKAVSCWLPCWRGSCQTWAPVPRRLLFVVSSPAGHPGGHGWRGRDAVPVCLPGTAPFPSWGLTLQTSGRVPAPEGAQPALTTEEGPLPVINPEFHITLRGLRLEHTSAVSEKRALGRTAAGSSPPQR